MATHALESQLDEKLFSEIADIKRQIREVRTTQQSSANAILVIGYPDPDPSFVVDTVAASSVLHHAYQIQPSDQSLTNWNFFVSVYVDLPGSTLDATYKLPFGSALSSAQKNIIVSTYPEWGDSSDATGLRNHIVTIQNRDTNPHDIVIAGKFYGASSDITP